MTWQGRELTSYYDGENYELSFGYNADGIRTYKEVYDASMGETLRHEYLLNGSQIIGEAVSTLFGPFGYLFLLGEY